MTKNSQTAHNDDTTAAATVDDGGSVDGGGKDNCQEVNGDWSALCSIYEDGVSASADDRQTRLVETWLAPDAANVGKSTFCGTVYMTVSTSKVAFARRVNEDPIKFRYFVLQRPPMMKIDFFYQQSTRSDDEESYGPSAVLVNWEYYPVEWPLLDQEPYREHLAHQCQGLLENEDTCMAFAVCEFLEHQLLSTFARAEVNVESECVRYWTTLVDKDDGIHNPGEYQLVILPPEMDRMYHSNVGTLIQPREEAALVTATMRKTKFLEKLRTSSKSKMTKGHSSDPPPFYAHANNILDFAKHALIHCWKHLYTTSCPVCLEENILYSAGIVLTKCQHYCCDGCFQTYLKYKVKDLAQHRTNPFLCPVETCEDRELPVAAMCRRFLNQEDQAKVQNWYRDLIFPPCSSLDRCLNVKQCGAVGCMRRKPMPSKSSSSSSRQRSSENDSNYNHYNNNDAPPALGGFFHHAPTPMDREEEERQRQERLVQDEKNRRTKVKALSTTASSLIFCEKCDKTWCEMCLRRVLVGEEEAHYRRGADSQSTPRCQPQAVLIFCRRYMDASKDKQQEFQAKFPWIANYSLFCQHDGAAVEYLHESGGQRCPNCRTGVERIEGCFHMKCPNCATHFCYECGDELFPPYYGTHHCWEEAENMEGDGARRQENRLDEEMAARLMVEEALGVEAGNYIL